MYQYTSARTFSVGATLVSRNADDAGINQVYLQTLRSWAMPYFGATSTLSQEQRLARTERRLNEEQGFFDNATAAERIRNEGVSLTGAPPDVLYLYAYSLDSTSKLTSSGERTTPTGNINRVPVVLTSLDIAYPDDVDYIPIPSGSGYEPFPVKMSVSLTLVETHSPREFERFDLAAFKMGTLANF